MERQLSQRPATRGAGLWANRGWWLILAALMGWHAWLTLGLFGAERPWRGLTNDQPVLSGRHALHLYHGYLGANAFWTNARTVGYDPAFAAGYPKTPWFDSESKPAELFLWFTGGEYAPAAYKIGLAICWLLIPLASVVAARCFGFDWGTRCLAALVTILFCGSEMGQAPLRAGELALVLASALSLLALGLLWAYHQNPGFWTGLALAATGWSICFFQPMMLITSLPLLLLFYLTVGWQHRLTWHVGLLAALLVALAGNAPWLRDAVQYWWIRLGPVSAASGPLASPLEWFRQGLASSNPAPQAVALALLGCAALGLAAMSVSKEPSAARLVAAAVVGYWLLGLVGESWEPLRYLEPARYCWTGLLFATPVAARGIVSLFAWAGRWTGSALRGTALLCAGMLVLGFVFHQPLGRLVRPYLRAEPLPVGIPADVASTVEILNEVTTVDARILWEETPETDRWSPLLPVLTQRFYVGGLGAEANIEHTAARLTNGTLLGRPIEDWSSDELAQYCRRYNIGWIVCRTSASVQRLRNRSSATAPRRLPGGGYLFTVSRSPSYFLAGQGRVIRCDRHGLTLADVTPVDGQVVLSFHYYPKVIASTDRVRLEREVQVHDMVPFLRLRVPGPMSRLTLYWQE